MAKNRSVRIALGVAWLGLTVLIVWFNVINIEEAFGSGPPYYGQTTNMDKWFDPLPMLAVVDVLGILVTFAYIYFLTWKK
ncbi:hypothetical protein [Paraburkholderia caffeinilytica]|uniref:hypothetical protein n=1 Tax=Paraburkholderia caffeinilytica TaxID=1761016 RepID=UPI003DA04B11